MIDLTAIAGFPITLAGLRLTFHEPVTSAGLAVRKSSDQRQFWRDDPPEAEEDRELLAAYWGIARAKDEEAFLRNGLEHVYALMLPPDYGHMTVNLGTDVLVFEAFLIAGVQPLAEPSGGRFTVRLSRGWTTTIGSPIRRNTIRPGWPMSFDRREALG